MANTTQLFPGFSFRQDARRSSRPWQGLIVDNFAGGGGASLGIEMATGRAVDISINHDPDAVEMHRLNHPASRHACENVWEVEPRQITRGRPVDLAWFSPDCTDFSRAKGGKPVRKRIRGLAWVVLRWAGLVRPKLIILENVREFRTWGPLNRNHRRIKSKIGQTFNRWLGQLAALGYAVEYRELDAADFGAPTHRKRLFVIARCDGQEIHWPKPTHGKGLKPYRTAAECIDWSIPCPSIFDRKRPLAEKTMRRIAIGLKRYVLDNPRPFIVRCAHGEGRWGHDTVDLESPLPTVTASKDFALVTPYIAGVGGPGYAGKPRPIDRPMGVIQTQNHAALIAPTLIQTGYGEREGQAPRSLNLNEPLVRDGGAGKGAA